MSIGDFDFPYSRVLYSSLTQGRIVELCEQFHIADADVLKHRLEDWERWKQDIRERGEIVKVCACCYEHNQEDRVECWCCGHLLSDSVEWWQRVKGPA